MRKPLFFAVLMICLPLLSHATEARFGDLEKFTTDACTDFPDGTAENPTLWQACCVRHDLKYWAGGSFAERLQADFDLRQCVSDLGQPEIADIMFLGVRVSGSPFLPTPWRWGYGWPYVRGYSGFSDQEQAEAASLRPVDLGLVPIVKYSEVIDWTAVQQYPRMFGDIDPALFKALTDRKNNP